MECPKCGSEKVTLIESAYPEAFECKKCKFVFTKTPQALRDEELD